MKFIAFTTKGLEKVVEEEITSSIFDAQIIEISDKRVVFESDDNYEQLTKLKTIDDLGLLLAESDGVVSLNDVVNTVGKIDFLEARKILENYRNIDSNNFSITASLSRVKSFKSNELISELSKQIEQKYNLIFNEFKRSDFDIRVFIDHQKCIVAARLSSESLHHRPYKTSSKVGSLKPTVAAAMVKLSTHGLKNLKIVDNFCGSGTILAECLLDGQLVYGGDIDALSVELTKNNLSNLGYKGENKIIRLNALATNWPINLFDCAISNLPWGKQIAITSITDMYLGSLKEYERIIKSDGVICLVITKPDLLVKHARKIFPNAKFETYPIGLLGQNPTIVVIRR